MISATDLRSLGPGKCKVAPRFGAGIGGAPVLQGAAASFECHSRHRYYGGDHVVVIGVVERYFRGDERPLVFHRGQYAQIFTPHRE